MLCDKYPLNIDCPQNTQHVCLLSLLVRIFLLIILLINYTWKCASICNTCAVNPHEKQTKNIIFQDIYIYIYIYTQIYRYISISTNIFEKIRTNIIHNKII